MHINIYDLLEYARDGCPRHKSLKLFVIQKELSDYTYNSEPAKVHLSGAASNGGLQFMLRGIAAYQSKDRLLRLKTNNETAKNSKQGNLGRGSESGN
jgi:hypothetical protein